MTSGGLRSKLRDVGGAGAIDQIRLELININQIGLELIGLVLIGLDWT